MTGAPATLPDPTPLDAIAVAGVTADDVAAAATSPEAAPDTGEDLPGRVALLETQVAWLIAHMRGLVAHYGGKMPPPIGLPEAAPEA